MTDSMQLKSPFVVYGKGAELRYSVRDANGALVCTSAYNGGCIEDRERTAGMIAYALTAAPIMLDALKSAEWMLARDRIDPEKLKVLEQVQDAIRAAGGKARYG